MEVKLPRKAVTMRQMASFRSILFPVDFSERCRSAAPFVRAMTQRFDAELTLMYVVELPTSVYTKKVGYDTMLPMTGIRQTAQEQIDVFARTVLGGVRLCTRIEEGQADERITAYAEEHESGLIMIPSHGYGSFRSALLGSVTAKVLHDASCPVWTDAHFDIPRARAQVDCKSMLCAVDLKSHSVPLIRRAVRLADDLGATLRLVHAVPAAARRETHFDEEFRRFLFEMAREELRKIQAEAGTALQVCMEAGSVAKVVRDATTHHEADLIVVGRGVIQESLGRLRTNMYAVIRESICPVLNW